MKQFLINTYDKANDTYIKLTERLGEVVGKVFDIVFDTVSNVLFFLLYILGTMGITMFFIRVFDSCN